MKRDRAIALILIFVIIALTMTVIIKSNRSPIFDTMRYFTSHHD